MFLGRKDVCDCFLASPLCLDVFTYAGADMLASVCIHVCVCVCVCVFVYVGLSA